MQPEVVIYTTPTCTYCNAAKRWFRDHGVAYTEHDVSRDPVKATEMYRLTGQGAVPVIRVGGQVMIGFDPLQLAKLLPDAGNSNGGSPTPEKLSLGMAAQSLTQEKADELGLPSAFGVVVGPVRPGGVAEAAGLREGDILIGLGSYTLQNLAQLQAVVAAKRPGDSLDLRIWRGGEELDATVEFPPVEAAPAAEPATPGVGEPAAPEAALDATSPDASSEAAPEATPGGTPEAG
jgi:glutaredoxin